MNSQPNTIKLEILEFPVLAIDTQKFEIQPNLLVSGFEGSPDELILIACAKNTDPRKSPLIISESVSLSKDSFIFKFENFSVCTSKPEEFRNYIAEPFIIIYFEFKLFNRSTFQFLAGCVSPCVCLLSFYSFSFLDCSFDQFIQDKVALPDNQNKSQPQPEQQQQQQQQINHNNQ